MLKSLALVLLLLAFFTLPTYQEAVVLSDKNKGSFIQKGSKPLYADIDFNAYFFTAKYIKVAPQKLLMQLAPLFLFAKDPLARAKRYTGNDVNWFDVLCVDLEQRPSMKPRKAPTHSPRSEMMKAQYKEAAKGVDIQNGQKVIIPDDSENVGKRLTGFKIQESNPGAFEYGLVDVRSGRMTALRSQMLGEGGAEYAASLKASNKCWVRIHPTIWEENFYNSFETNEREIWFCNSVIFIRLEFDLSQIAVQCFSPEQMEEDHAQRVAEYNKQKEAEWVKQKQLELEA